MGGYKKPAVREKDMEEGELEEWFNSQKERLEAEVYAALQANKETEKAKLLFDKKYRALILELQKRENTIYEQKVRAEKRRVPIQKMQTRWQEFVTPIKAKPRELRMAMKKWLFERKIKKILRDKSDL
jgi:hypothetical protein